MQLDRLGRVDKLKMARQNPDSSGLCQTFLFL